MDERTKKLEEIIKCMLQPLKNIPLDIVIDALSWHKIIPFNRDDYKDQQILKDLINVAKLSWETANIEWIVSTRANEVWNYIEQYVKKACNKLWMKASTPHSESWREKSTWYPDIEFIDRFWNIQYLEIKTFNIKNINTTQRTFYLSPSEDFKITNDAHHFLMSFEVEQIGKKWSDNIYRCNWWKILALENLDVDVKYEFNSNNKKLYSDTMIIAEWSFNENENLSFESKYIQNVYA